MLIYGKSEEFEEFQESQELLKVCFITEVFALGDLNCKCKKQAIHRSVLYIFP